MTMFGDIDACELDYTSVNIRTMHDADIIEQNENKMVNKQCSFLCFTLHPSIYA